MNEYLLHYIWEYQYFNDECLQTTDGEPIRILHPGIYNQNAGPDFFNSRIKIGNTTWAGNLEIHLRSSDWMRHQHQLDAAYNNVILHVVLQHDTDIQVNSLTLPTLELDARIDDQLIKLYQQLMKSQNWIACQPALGKIPSELILNWQSQLLVERLERKSIQIIERLKANRNNWEETFYQLISMNFGFKTNSLPFEMLAMSLPQKILSKHKNNLFQLEALLFGQSGYLEKEYKDQFPKKLKKEFSMLSRKFKLHPIDVHLWKFSRLRPTNFPTLRIAQFATLIHSSTFLFSRLLECESLTSIRRLLKVETSDYWTRHFTFDKDSNYQPKTLGHKSIDNIIINSIVPLLYTYGKKMRYEKIKKESNFIFKKYKSRKEYNNAKLE